MSQENNSDNKKQNKERHDHLFNYEKIPTRYSITIAEQKVLILVILIIVISLAIQSYKNLKKEKVFIYNKNINTDSQMKSANIFLSENFKSTKEDFKENTSKNSFLTESNISIVKEQVKELNLYDRESQININTASEQELIKLKGIGPSKASSIIAYRNHRGKFNSIEELKSVNGIGDKIFLDIKDSICVDNVVQNNDLQNFASPGSDDSIIYKEKNFKSDSQNTSHTIIIDTQKVSEIKGNISGNRQEIKININTASKEELMDLEKIGEVLALRIIEYRIKNGFFKNPEDLKKVKGIGDKIFNLNNDKIITR